MANSHASMFLQPSCRLVHIRSMTTFDMPPIANTEVDPSEYIYRLTGPVYGQRDAPRRWYETVIHTLTQELGFIASLSRVPMTRVPSITL